MAEILILLAIASGIAIAVVVIVKVKEARESRVRRTVASPYGVLMAPTDAELRRTREVHPQSIEIHMRGGWKKNCSVCDGCGNIGTMDGLIECPRCDGRGNILTQGEGAENGS